MITTDFIALVNDAWRGTDDVPPTAGTDDWDYWVRTANRIKRNLYKDTTKQWVSTYEVLELGAITASADLSFDLDDTFIAPAEGCYAIGSNGSRHDFSLIHAQEVRSNVQTVFIAGQNPQTLYFSAAIAATEGYVGATLYLPAYVMPDDFKNANDTVDVDDPDWLVVATAAKLAFNDVTYEPKAGDLQNEANALYKQMVNNTRRGTAGNPRKSSYNVTRIGQRHSTRYV